ncbi:MAG: ComF family protein [Thermodesulfobacteriota bacterium]
MAAGLGLMLASLRDLAFPAGCLGCAQPPRAEEFFCPDCLERVAWIAEACPRCGRPGAGADCPACALATPAWELAWAPARHAGPLAEAVRAFKYRRRWASGVGLARLLAHTAPAWLTAGADLVIPVPLHPRRLLRRGFNQAAVLAGALGGGAGAELAPRLLLRRRHTRPQVGLSPQQRLANVAGAFAVRPAALARLAGRRVLLVDDVYTTGATLAECAQVLLAAGAAAVRVATVSRAGRPHPARQSGDAHGL